MNDNFSHNGHRQGAQRFPANSNPFTRIREPLARLDGTRCNSVFDAFADPCDAEDLAATHNEQRDLEEFLQAIAPTPYAYSLLRRLYATSEICAADFAVKNHRSTIGRWLETIRKRARAAAASRPDLATKLHPRFQSVVTGKIPDRRNARGQDANDW